MSAASPESADDVLGGAHESADGVDVYRGYFGSFDGTRLYTVRWTSDAAEASDLPTVVIHHGYAEHVERYHELARALVAAGFPTMGLDARGHGRSDGPRGYVERYDDYVRDLRLFFGQVAARYPSRRRALFGHSNGGLIALRFVQTHPDQSQTLVLTGPAIGLSVKVPLWKSAASKVLTRLAPKLGMPTEIDPSVVTRTPEIVEAYANDPLVSKVATPRYFTELLAAQQIAVDNAAKVTLPVLCLQGDADKLIDPEATRAFMQRVGSDDCTFAMLAGHYHEVLNEPERATHRATIVDWLLARYGDQG